MAARNLKVRKKVSKVVAPKIILTLNQALSIQLFLSKKGKSIRFLDSKIANI